MRASRLLALPVLVPVLALAAAACSSSTPPGDAQPAPEPVAAATSAIINGQNDTTHQAVVAIIAQDPDDPNVQEECSGTIVKTDTTRHIGWVLTAAHCVAFPPAVVFQGDDFLSPSAIHYSVIDYKAYPGYDQNGSAGQLHDFAVIRIAGVDSSTPAIAYAGPSDGVSVGTSVVMVGYGRTTLNSSGAPGDNSVRHSVTKQVGEVQSGLLRYNQATGGVCQGDSGGPDLVGSGSSMKVVGVHSFVEGDCNGGSGSGRVSESINLGFIDGELSKALPADTCALCSLVSSSGNQECAQLNSACFADKDCKGYYDCATKCSTAACQQSCLAKFPKAEGPLNAAAGCACTRTCATQCKGALDCRGVPKCGYAFPAGDCTTCTESTCCQEALDCGADGECYLCLKNGDADPACAKNAARKKLATCVATSCSDACAGTGLDTGADPSDDTGEDDGSDDGDGSGGGKTTTTTSGCAVASRAAGGPEGPGRAGSALALGALGIAVAVSRRRRARALSR
jgi:hypothetical protein